MQITKRLSHCKDPKNSREGTKISIKCLQIRGVSNGSNSLIVAESKYGSNYAYRSMPQNLAGWLVRYFLSKLLIRSMSSLLSSKSKTWKFSSNLSGLAVFGMTTVSRWMPHRRTIWATVLLYFAANPWNREKQDDNNFARPELEKFCSDVSAF